MKSVSYTHLDVYKRQVFDINYLHDYDFWVADYSSVPNFNYHFSIWQYTDAGTVDGISTNVDMNIMFVKK